MKNLLQNSDWRVGKNSVPQYYSGVGPITYDRYALSGFRTCSITMPNNRTAMYGYDLLIDVEGMRELVLAITMRAIEITKVSFVIEFYANNKRTLNKKIIDVTKQVGEEFGTVEVKCEIPTSAKYVKWYWQFDGKVIACTYCAPVVYAM